MECPLGSPSTFREFWYIFLQWRKHIGSIPYLTQNPRFKRHFDPMVRSLFHYFDWCKGNHCFKHSLKHAGACIASVRRRSTKRPTTGLGRWTAMSGNSICQCCRIHAEDKLEISRCIISNKVFFLLSTIVVWEQKLKQGLERGPTLLVQPWPEVHWHEGSYLCPFSGSIVTCRWPGGGLPTGWWQASDLI